jgi:glycosyltransferase involved in cell wall biosynthesis
MERAVYHLARHLQLRGVDTVLFTRPATEPHAFPGAVVEVPYPRGPRHGSVLDRSLRYPRFVERLGAAVAERVRAGSVDVVDAQGLTALGYGRRRRADPALRAPLVMNPQGMEELKTRGLKRAALWRLRRLSREAAALADRVVATDESTRGDVPRLLQVPEEKVVVLPNGIDPEEVARLTPRDARAAAEQALPALRGAPLVLLSVGRVERYKGFDTVAAALERLAAARALPERWAWVVVGAGPHQAALRGRLDGHLLLPGRVDDALLHALYARADLFVHATRFEGSSLVTLEAMCHGLPVVGTRAGGIPDKVVDGETGRLVPPGDPDALAAALQPLLASPARRIEMGERGRQRALARFSWSVLVDRTIELYAELLRRRA